VLARGDIYLGDPDQRPPRGEYRVRVRGVVGDGLAGIGDERVERHRASRGEDLTSRPIFQ
jgi:hypothetical protein